MRGSVRLQLIGLWGVVERNTYLIKRYGWWELAFFIWTIANTLTIVFIAKGVQATGGHINVQKETTSLLIGAVLWSYLGIIFELMTETVAWERWEGTIEYTFMAPLSRVVHLCGVAMFAVLYGLLRTALLFLVIALFFGLHFSHADFLSALVLLAVASISFAGLGIVTSVLPLISPRRARSSASSRRACCLSSPGSTTRSRFSRGGCAGSRPFPLPPMRCAESGRRSSTVHRWDRGGPTSGRCWCSASSRSRSAWRCSKRVSATPSATAS